MSRLLALFLGFAVVAAPVAAGQDEVPTWQSYAGFWRMDPEMLSRSPTTPLVMKIQVVGDELTIERRYIISATETSRYRLDGQTSDTVLDGQPAKVSAVL